MRLLVLTIVAAIAVAATPCTATAAVAISNELPLAFGTFVSPMTSGSVTVAPDGTRTTAAVIPIGAYGFSAASFTVTNSGPGNPHYQIVLPSSITLTGESGGAMLIDSFVSNPSGVGVAQPPSNTDTLTVGATLHVESGQRPGEYHGAFLIVATGE